jgi:hypothetical protein
MHDSHTHYSFFGEPWWLDTVCGAGGWDEVSIETDGRLDARLPFVVKRRRGVTTVGMPPYTQKLGPWFVATGGRESAVMARQKDLTKALLRGLPRHDVFRQSFHDEVSNWLPWYWQNFQQTTRYSYVLSPLDDLDNTWKGLQTKIRGDIRKSSKRFALVVRSDLGVGTLIDLCRKTSERQDRRQPRGELIERIVSTATARGVGRLFFAVDGEGRAHAAAFTVWDERRACYLIGGGDPELRNSGAQSFVLWEAIRHAASVSRAFDFEGSMVESIERFFRGFGARQVPYSHVTRMSGRIPTAAFHLRAGIGALLRGRPDETSE